LSFSLPLQPGTYYILIEEYTYYHETYGGYKITPTFVEQPIANDSEDNGSFQRAIDLPISSTAYGHIGYIAASNGSKDVVDWYKVVAANDGVIKVDFLGDSTLNAYVGLYASDGSTRLAYTTGKDKALTIAAAVQAGTYYVYVEENTYYDETFGGYRLTPTFDEQPIANDSEDNGSFQRANDIQIGSPVSGHIGYRASSNGNKDVVDWYKVIVPNDGEIKIDLLGDSTLNAYVGLYASDGSTRLTYTAGQDKALTCTALVKSGTYYILVEENTYYDETYGGYQFTVSFTVK
jgi:hypothetical protein